MENIEKLYTPEDIRRLEIKKRRWKTALYIIAVGALSVCIALCALTRTGNAAQMEKAVIVLSALAGWLCLYIRRFPVKDTGHEIDHARMLLEGNGEVLSGELTVTKERLRIKNSITFRTVMLNAPGKSLRLKVIESRVRRVSALEGRPVRVEVVNGYIAGIGAP